MSKRLVKTIIVAVALSYPLTALAINVKPIKQSARYKNMTIELANGDRPQAARLAGGYFNALPLTFDNTLKDTTLYEVFKAANGGMELSEVYLEGFYSDADKYYKHHTGRLSPNEIVMVYWDLYSIQHQKRFFGFAVDRNINFRRSMAVRRKLLPMYMNDPALLAAFREDLSKLTIGFDQVGLGKTEAFERLLSRKRLNGRGFMREIFLNLDTFIRTRYKGWTLFMIPKHHTTLNFANNYERLPQENRYQIPGARLSVEEFRTIAEAIKLYITTELMKEGPFKLSQVYQEYSDVDVRLVDRVVYTQFDVEADRILRLKANPARLSEVVTKWYESLRQVEMMA